MLDYNDMVTVYGEPNIIDYSNCLDLLVMASSNDVAL